VGLSLFKALEDADNQERRRFLMNVPIFQGLKKGDITFLINILQERTYIKGETLFNEGDIGRALFIVVDGKVNLTRNVPGVPPVLLAEVRPGEIFGEMALLEEMPRTATAIAAEKTVVLMLFKSRLDALLYDYPKAGVFIIHYLARTLSSRLRAMTDQRNAGDKAK